MTEKKFELSTHSRMPYMSCKVWHFFRDTGTFEYYVSKNYKFNSKNIRGGRKSTSKMKHTGKIQNLS